MDMRGRYLVIILLLVCLAGTALVSEYHDAKVPHEDSRDTLGRGEESGAGQSEETIVRDRTNPATVVHGIETSNSEVTTQEVGEVVSVVDGDTIEVRMGDGHTERVRYIGIDTPETVHPSKPVQCFGREASAKNKELVLGQTVTLERDVTDRDKYGRLLRYVYVGDLMINDALVRGGFASVYTYPPDVKYDSQFREAEAQARIERVGLWGSVCDSYTAPSPAPSSVSTGPRGCTIKGNVNASGDKIFHVPGCKSYEKTTINEAQGERWFCTEQEAINAGWRKALNC